jgi:c(7)-type cytochrome triheme protein
MESEPQALTPAAPRRSTPEQPTQERKDRAPSAQARPAKPSPAAASAKVEPAARRGSRPSQDQNRFYDRASPAYGLLQKANEAMARFPVDRIGQILWIKAMREGTIDPRASVRGEGRMQVLEQDVIMENTRGMPLVRFPHAAHSELLACSNCHESIFVAKKGANPMTMNDIFLGEYCGVCHDKVAFSTYTCERCHNVPNPEAD